MLSSLFALGGDFGDELLQRVGLRGNVLVGLLGGGQKACGRFFRLLANFAQRFGGAGELFGVRGALRAALIGQMRGQVARYFFELGREALRQFFLERVRCGVVRFAAAGLRFFLNLFHCGCNVALQAVARLLYFFLPLFCACGAFRS